MKAKFFLAIIMALFLSGCGGCLSPISTGKKSSEQKAENRADDIESAKKRIAAIIEKEKKATRDLKKIADENSDEYFAAERKLAEIQVEKEKIQRDIDRFGANIGIGDAVGTAKRGLKWGTEQAKKGAKVGANVGADYAKEKEILPTGEDWLDKRLNGFVEKHASPEEEPESIDTPTPARQPAEDEKFLWSPKERRYVAIAPRGTEIIEPAAPPPESEVVEPESVKPEESEPETKTSRDWFGWLGTGWGKLVMITVGAGVLFLILIVVDRRFRRQQNP